MEGSDHDLIRDIHKDVKYLVEDFKSHKMDDKSQFETLSKKTDWNTKIIYMVLGGIALIEFVVKVIK